MNPNSLTAPGFVNVGATIEEMQKEMAEDEVRDAEMHKKMAALEKEVADLKHHLSVVVEHLKHRG